MKFPVLDFLPGISIDSVILGYDKGQLKVLTLEWAEGGKYLLPGGMIKYSENVDNAAKRIVEERSGIENVFLRQFKVFGDVNRRSDEELSQLLEAHKDKAVDRFMKQRFISIGYFALVNIDDVSPKPDIFSQSFLWQDVNDLKNLVFDHKEIVETALGTLQKNINLLILGDNLLPDQFTFSELQLLYETVLQTSLDRSNFQKKILKLNVLERHKKAMRGGAHKAPYLYSIKIEGVKKMENLKLL